MVTNRIAAGALNDARQARGLGMRELARLVGISSGYLNELEKGSRWGSPEMHARIALALGVSVETITYDASTHAECPRCHGRGVIPIVGGTPAGAAA